MLVCRHRSGQLSRVNTRTALGQASAVGHLGTAHHPMPAFSPLHILHDEEARKCHEIRVRLKSPHFDKKNIPPSGRDIFLMSNPLFQRPLRPQVLICFPILFPKSLLARNVLHPGLALRAELPQWHIAGVKDNSRNYTCSEYPSGYNCLFWQAAFQAAASQSWRKSPMPPGCPNAGR